MFRAVRPQWIVNDLGVEVSSEGRNTMQYRDRDHVLMLYCDAIADGNGRFGAAILLPHDAYWQPPFDQAPIDAATRSKIAQDLLDAWRVVDYWVTIEA